MHEAAAEHGTPLNSLISLQCHKIDCFNFVEPLWYGRNWPRSQSGTGQLNLASKKNTFSFSNYNELVDFLGIRSETP